jgi:hypothetical protein
MVGIGIGLFFSDMLGGGTSTLPSVIRDRSGASILQRDGASIYASIPPTRISSFLSDASTTGAINASSNLLTVSDAARFQVGNSIIVAVGGEAGASARGTHGVGGTWPALYYADATAMDADASKSEGTLCWLESTGLVWQFTSGSWTRSWGYATWYYSAKAIPKALIATITDKTGNQLTLSVAAETSASGAVVHLDNAEIFGLGVAMGRIDLPSGTFATSLGIQIDNRDNFPISGAGLDASEIFIPDGVAHREIVKISNCSGYSLTNFAVRGNGGNQGFALNVSGNAAFTGASTQLPVGIHIDACSGGEMRSVRAINCLSRPFSISFCTDCWQYDCEVVQTYPSLEYVQWAYEYADCVGGGAVDCVFSAPYITPAFEAFKSSGVSFIRCVPENGTFSINSSGNILLQDVSITIKADSSWDDLSQGSGGASSLFRNNPIVAFANNAGGALSALGANVADISIVIEGPINAANNALKAINANAVTDILVSGGSVVFENDYNGVNGNAQGIDADASVTGFDVEDFTVVGTPSPGAFNISIKFGSVTNCTANAIRVNY